MTDVATTLKKTLGTALVSVWTVVLIAPVLLALFVLSWPVLAAIGVW